MALLLNHIEINININMQWIKLGKKQLVFSNIIAILQSVNKYYFSVCCTDYLQTLAYSTKSNAMQNPYYLQLFNSFIPFIFFPSCYWATPISIYFSFEFSSVLSSLLTVPSYPILLSSYPFLFPTFKLFSTFSGISIIFSF